MVKLAAVCWQPTGHKDGSFDIRRGVLVKLAAVCCQPTGHKDGSFDIKPGQFWSNLQLYVGSLQVIRTEVLTSNRGVLVKLAAVCCQPTGHKDGSFDIKQGSFGQTCSGMLATYRS